MNHQSMRHASLRAHIESASPGLIYLDMDGTLACFASGVISLFGLSMKVEDFTAIDMPSKIGISQDEFWGHISNAGVSFWRDLPTTTEFSDIVNCARNSGAEVRVLTHPTAHWTSRSGKFAWLTKHGLSDLRVEFSDQRGKGRFAAKGRMLIDDFTHNCEDFHAHGGTALLIKRPWSVPPKLPVATC